ncbi:MAG: hypothetical protein H6740_23370 [Alphaproteobacteria bacterium]|nr:hypothetical protein [Alphaproteobacteria bacterium]
MLPLLSSGSPALALALGAAYAAAGLGVARSLRRRGEPLAASLSALVAWPLLIEGLRAPAPRPPARGPLGARIEQAFAALSRALAEDGGVDEAVLADLTALRSAVDAADRRLLRVDRLLSEEDALESEALAETRAQLTQARGHAQREIEAVLTEVLQLRIQVGLLALAGEGRPARERLQQLRARVRALDEVHGLGGEPPA